MGILTNARKKAEDLLSTAKTVAKRELTKPRDFSISAPVSAGVAKKATQGLQAYRNYAEIVTGGLASGATFGAVKPTSKLYAQPLYQPKTKLEKAVGFGAEMVPSFITGNAIARGVQAIPAVAKIVPSVSKVSKLGKFAPVAGKVVESVPHTIAQVAPWTAGDLISGKRPTQNYGAALALGAGLSALPAGRVVAKGMRDYKIQSKPKTAMMGEDAGLLDVSMDVLQDTKNRSVNELKKAITTIRRLSDGYLNKQEVDKAVKKMSGKSELAYYKELGRTLIAKSREVAPDYAYVDKYGLGVVGNKGDGVSANQDLINEARKYKSAEEFIKAQKPRVEIDQYGKNIVGEKEGIKIAVNDTSSPTYITLWDGNKQVGSLRTSNKSIGMNGYLQVGNVEVNPKYRNRGLATEMYKTLEKYSDDAKGIVGYSPDIVNKKAIPSIYKKLGGRLDENTGNYVIDFKKPTKSQLTDIYNQSKGNGVSASASRNLDMPAMGFVDSNFTPAIPQQPKAPTYDVLDKLKSSSAKGRSVGEVQTTSGIKAKLGDAKKAFRSQVMDRFSAIEDFTKPAVKELTTEQNPYKRFRLLAGVDGKIEATLKTQLGPVLKKEANRLDDLDVLLKLERMQEKAGQGFKTQLSTDEIQKGFGQLEQKYGQEGLATLKQSSQEIRNFGNTLLDKLKASGIIGDESYNAIKKNNQFYTPFEIVDYMSDNLEKGYGSGSYNAASQDVIKAFKGSEREVGNTIDAFIRKAGKVIALTEKNDALNSLVNLRKFKGYDDLIKEVDGVIPEGYGKVNAFVNGQNKTFAVPQEVEIAVKNLDKQQMNFLTKALTVPARVLRLGATGLNVAFIPANLVRDFADAVYSEATEGGMKSVGKFLQSYPRAFASAVKRDELYDKWLMSGGAQSSFIKSEVLGSPQTTLKRLAGKEAKFAKVLSAPKDLIEFIGRTAEESTRLARFEKGLRTGESAMEAAYKSRNITVDFGRSGTIMKLANQFIPFLNAGTQGTGRMLSLIKDNPRRAVVTATTLIGMPVAALYANNRNFKDFRDLAQYEKDSNWIIMVGDRTPEEVENDEPLRAIKIPKGNQLKPLSNILENFLAYFDNEDPRGFAQMSAEVLGNVIADTSPIGAPTSGENARQFVGNLTPQAIKPFIEQATNTNLFTGRNIVPQSMEGIEPREQYDDRTSLVAKTVGGALNMSPKRIDALVKGVGAGVGQQALSPSKVVSDTVGRFYGPAGGNAEQRELADVNKISTQSKTESYIRKRDAKKLDEELAKMDKAQAKAKVAEIKAQDPLLYKKLKAIVDERKLDRSYTESRIAGLTVQDGARAKYIAMQAGKLKTKEEKNAYIADLKAKKIITAEVWKQLLEMKKSGTL